MNAVSAEVNHQMNLLPCETQLKVEKAKVAALITDRDEVITKNLILQAEADVHREFLLAALEYCLITRNPLAMTEGSYVQDNRINAYQKMMQQFKQLQGETPCLSILR